MHFIRPLGLILCFGLLAPVVRAGETPSTPSAPTLSFAQMTPSGYLVAATIAIPLYLYTQVNYKTTVPHRIYPGDDASWQEWLLFIHDEYLIGQKYYAERQAAFHIDPENPERFIYEYSKIPARGLAGQTQFYMNNVIIPTAVLLIALKTFKTNIKESFIECAKLILNPASIWDLPAPKANS